MTTTSSAIGIGALLDCSGVARLGGASMTVTPRHGVAIMIVDPTGTLHCCPATGRVGVGIGGGHGAAPRYLMTASGVLT